MNCHTAESMIAKYISHSLSVQELEEFLAHIEGCPSCYDELETYFIVHEAVGQLDQGEQEVLDFKHLLEQDIRKSRKYIRRRKLYWIICATVLCLALALVIFLFFSFIGVI